MDEVWKDVVGYEGVYQVSNLGRIKSKNGKVIKPNITRKGYHRYNLYINREMKGKSGHSMVLEAFVEKRPEGKICRHLNGNPADNALSNLVWGTYKENEADKKKHGTVELGERHHQAKLTNEQVIEIRKTFKGWDRKLGILPMSKKYNVSTTTISEIVRNISYKQALGDKRDESNM